MKNYNANIVCTFPSCKKDCKVFTGIVRDVYPQSKIVLDKKFSASCDGGESERDVFGRSYEVEGSKVFEHTWPKVVQEVCRYGIAVTGQKEEEIMSKLMDRFGELTAESQIVQA
jgi:hypothetical protein